MKTVLQVTSVLIRSLFVLLFNFYQFLLVTYNLFAGLPCLFLLHCYDISSVTQRRGHQLHLYWHIRSLTIGITFLSLLMDKKRITWKLIRKLNKNPYISIILSLILPGRYLEDGRPLANWLIDVEKNEYLTHECCTLCLTFLFWLVKAEIT